MSHNRTCACGATLGVNNKSGRCHPCAVATLARGPEAPREFIEIAATTSNRALMERFGVGPGILARWRRETGIGAPNATIGRKGSAEAAPAGFALAAPDLTIKELRERYSRGDQTIKRWLAETGTRARTAAHTSAGRPGSATRKFSPVAPRVHSEAGRAGQAANFLRRFGPVFRCDADGRQLQDGFFWNRGGRTVLTDEELIERAKRNGWQPDAWREVRAA